MFVVDGLGYVIRSGIPSRQQANSANAGHDKAEEVPE